MAKIPMAVPIIFVPGIMGSRLYIASNESKFVNTIVWDPGGWDVFGEMMLSAKERKQNLIGTEFDKDFLAVAGLWNSPIEKDKKYWKKHNIYGHETVPVAEEHKTNPVHLAMAEQPRRKRGWGGVLWDSYGEILEHLERFSRNITTSSGNCHVYLPVWAHGYNWTASNRDSGENLAQTIDAAIQEMTDLGLQCDKVLIVSHSMGGFVTRAASELHGKSGQIASVCHVAMPDNGSPATYKRMKAGFEGGFPFDWAAKQVLGENGQEVTAVLAHSPGGLELLPNKHYRQSNGETGCWLTLEDSSGDKVDLFEGSDAYRIYSEPSSWWRLVNPAWMYPEKTDLTEEDASEFFEKDYLSNTLEQAMSFHDDLGENKHKFTWMVWGTENFSWDKTQWELKDGSMFASQFGFPAQPMNPKDVDLETLKRYVNDSTYKESGNGVLDIESKQPKFRFGSSYIAKTSLQIADPKAKGDGTVHAGAGKYATHAKDLYKFPVKTKNDHQDILKDENVKGLVERFIKEQLKGMGCQFKRLDGEPLFVIWKEENYGLS